MFALDRESIKKALHIMQRQHCSYDMMSVRADTRDAPPPMCDCKYGYGVDVERFGEKTGCPELRCAVELLSLMTDDEYNSIIKRQSSFCFRCQSYHPKGQECLMPIR